MNNDKVIGDCDCCHIEGVFVEEYDDLRPTEKKILCFVCANTHIGSIYSQFTHKITTSERFEIAQLIAESTWLILKAIKGQDYKGE